MRVSSVDVISGDIDLLIVRYYSTKSYKSYTREENNSHKLRLNKNLKLRTELFTISTLYDLEVIKDYNSVNEVDDVVFIHKAWRTLELKYKSNQLSDDRYHRILNEIFSLIDKCGFYERQDKLFNHAY